METYTALTQNPPEEVISGFVTYASPSRSKTENVGLPGRCQLAETDAVDTRGPAAAVTPPSSIVITETGLQPIYASVVTSTA
jgi:hypothetical protein